MVRPRAGARGGNGRCGRRRERGYRCNSELTKADHDSPVASKERISDLIAAATVATYIYVASGSNVAPGGPQSDRTRLLPHPPTPRCELVEAPRCFRPPHEDRDRP